MAGIIKQQLEELRWLRAFLDSLAEASHLLDEQNFPTDPDVNFLVGGLRSTVDVAASRWQRLKRFVEMAQAKCCHDFVDYREFDTSYTCNSSDGEIVLVAKVCSRCKLILERPVGSPSDVCFKCWSPMRSDGVYHSQCTNPNCGHFESGL